MARYFVRGSSAGRAQLDKLFSERAAPEIPGLVYRSRVDPDLVVADLDDYDVVVASELGSRIYADIEFQVMPSPREANPPTSSATGDSPTVSLATVLDQINAPAAWRISRGSQVTIAVVDTGVRKLERVSGSQAIARRSRHQLLGFSLE